MAENGERLKKVILDDFKCVVGFEGDSGEWEAEDTLRLFIKRYVKIRKIYVSEVSLTSKTI